jgi:hypothetical protein
LIGLLGTVGGAQTAKETVLDELRAEIIPAEGTETAYGIPLSLTSLPQFVEWWYTLRPAVELDARYFESLNGLVAPCCDDNQAYKCCCETNGSACNIIRSAKGLASHLIHDLDYTADQVSASVMQWLQFARPDYYMADELRNRQMSPLYYGLTAQGSCYRGLCETPISQGGCGGMGELIEPAIETTES